MVRKDSALRQKSQNWRYAQYISVVLVAVSIALPHQLNLVAISAFFVITTYYTEGSLLIKSIKENTLLQLLIAFVLLSLVAAIRDKSIQSFFSTLERRSVIFILPFMFSTVTLEREQINNILRYFVISVTVAIIWSFVSLHTDNIVINAYDFTHYFWQLSEHTAIPSNYLALYASFAIIILIHKGTNEGLFKKHISLLFILAFFFFIAMVGARMAFLLTVFLLTFRLAYLAIIQKHVLKLVQALLLILVSIASVTFIPYLNEKFASLGSSKDPRYYEFTAAWEVFEMSPVFGHGFKQAETEMLRQYKQMNFHDGTINLFNAHNEYLQTAITMGLLGVILVSVILFFSIRNAFKSGDFLAITFLILFSFAGVTEALLSRNKGIVFFGFFIGLLLFSNKPESEVQ